MTIDREHLQWFYEQTHYTVLLSRQRITFLIGKHDPALDEIVRQHCQIKNRWAIITPYNPESESEDADTNHLALVRLRRELTETGLKYYDSVNQSPEGEWHELGCFVVDPDSAQIKAAARRYRQNAYVEAAIGEAPRLTWLI